MKGREGEGAATRRTPTDGRPAGKGGNFYEECPLLSPPLSLSEVRECRLDSASSLEKIPLERCSVDDNQRNLFKRLLASAPWKMSEPEGRGI